jgi:hypothetical protein
MGHNIGVTIQGWRREDGSVATVAPETCYYCRTGQALWRAKGTEELSEVFSLYRAFLNNFVVRMRSVHDLIIEKLVSALVLIWSLIWCCFDDSQILRWEYRSPLPGCINPIFCSILVWLTYLDGVRVCTSGALIFVSLGVWSVQCKLSCICKGCCTQPVLLGLRNIL